MLGLYWLLLFAWLRGVFFAFNHRQVEAVAARPSEVLIAFWHALPLDLSTMAWFLIFPWLLYFIRGFGALEVSRHLRVVGKFLITLWVGTFTILTVATAIGESAVYPEWKTKLTYRAITALRNPTEIFSITTTWHILALFVVIVSTAIGFLWIWQRYFWRRAVPYSNFHILSKTAWTAKLGASIAHVTLMFSVLIGLAWFARGGFKAIPISLSRVFYSQESILNDAAANPVWHLGFNLAASMAFISDENPFAFMSREKSVAIVEKLHQAIPTNKRAKEQLQPLVIKTQPNVVFIVLESWSADLIESLGGDARITPEFHSLEQEGVLFDNFYANGNRSQQGIASIFAGFPALPLVAVTDNPAKTNKLPRLAERFSKAGYHTSFLYGGQLEYGNIGAFLKYNGFQTIKEEVDFPAKLPRGNMGIHDEFMFREHLNYLNTAQEPFFSALFTLSTHSPYDMPGKENLHWEGTLEADYVKSAIYTDRELGAYMRAVKAQPWYERTLFVIVADHSHNSYRNWPNWRPEYRKIPLLITGGALNPYYRGRSFSKIASHVDIPATVLNSLGMDAKEFPWSKNIFDNHAPAFAYYELNYGFGWVTPAGQLVFDKELQSARVSTVPKSLEDEATLAGMAYTQAVFQAFLDL